MEKNWGDTPSATLIFTQVKQINETNKKGKKKIKGNSDITYYEAHTRFFVCFFCLLQLKQTPVAKYLIKVF